MKLTKDNIRKMIMEEMAMLINDDAIFHKKDLPGDLDDHEYDEETEDYDDDYSCSVCGAEYGSCAHYDEEMEPEEPEAVDHTHHHKKGHSYMAKPQLMKIARYAQSLHDMIPDGMALDDWQESHIAQLADDIGEVYHSLEYKMKYKNK